MILTAKGSDKNRSQCHFLSFGETAPQWAMVSSFTKFLDNTQRRTTVGRTPLDKWSARTRDLYMNTQHSQQTNIHALGGIRTQNLSRRAAVDLCLKPRGHWERPIANLPTTNHRGLTRDRTRNLAERGRRTGHLMRVHTLCMGHENQHVDAVYENNDSWWHVLWAERTGCSTRYRTRRFSNNSNISEDIATKFEQEYVRCMRSVTTSQHVLEVATICAQAGLNPAFRILESPCQYVRCHCLNFDMYMS
jgi:hypothetical protein